MKKYLLLTILLISCLSQIRASECVFPPQFVGNTGVNMTVFLISDVISALPISSDSPYVVATTNSGLVIGSSSLAQEDLYEGQQYVAIFGDDTDTPEIDGALAGEELYFQLVDGGLLYDLEFSFAGVNQYITNAVLPALSVTLNFNCAVNFGCTDESACNYDPYVIDDDGSCFYSEPYYNCNGACLNDFDGDGVCDELEVPGCTDDSYLEAWDRTTISYQENEFYYLLDPINATENDGSCVELIVEACVDSNYVEYNADANVFNLDLCQNLIVYGCTDESSFNFNIDANTDDGSCYPIIIGCMDQTAFNYIELTGDPFIDVNTNAPELCVPVIYGCLDPEAYNFNDYDSDGEYNELTGILGLDVNTDDGSCIERVYGCLDDDYVEYNDIANTDDGSCQMLLRVAYNELTESHQDLTESYEELDSASSVAVSELQLIIESWNTTIDLEGGWNMFGYGCPDPIDLNSVLDSYIDIELVKDNNGLVYWPEFDFNGIGDFTPGFGYQIKVTEAIEGFSLCDWYVNDIPEDNIVSLQEEVLNLTEENTNLIDSLSMVNSLIGCTDILACNFNPSYLYGNGSCEYPEENYDCNGFVIAEIGTVMEGGYLFYIDSTGQHGLVAALEDLYGFYRWGCYHLNVNGADGIEIGSGLENTMDIINQQCSNENISVSSAEACVNFETNNYNDWYLPSGDELYLMFFHLGGLNSEYGFEEQTYWSSSESDHVLNHYVYTVSMTNGNYHIDSKSSQYKVRPIRSF